MKNNPKPVMNYEKAICILIRLGVILRRLYSEFVQRYPRGDEREQVHDPRRHGSGDHDKDGGNV